MKRIALLLLAAISALGSASAATRPRYGGTLRVMVQSAPSELTTQPTSSASEYWDSSRILSLIADNLVTVDAQDRTRRDLAAEWQSDATNRHWQFNVRQGVKFHDGSPATAGAIAQILGGLHADWSVHAAGDTLTIDTELPSPSLPAELALPRNLILKRNASGLPVGTGPFLIADWQPGKLLKLAANEQSWAGRPFLDAIEVEFGKSFRDQSVALELGRADLIEAPPQASNSPRLATSLPVELLALVATPNSRAQNPHLREALALSIDRRPIQSVLLKGAGEPAASLLPNWMTGYSATFSVQPNLQRAKALAAESRQPPLTLSYDPRDPQAQLIAERIALNAREAGIAIQVSLSGVADVNLIRIVLPSTDPATSLRSAAQTLGLQQPLMQGNSLDALYSAERGML